MLCALALTAQPLAPTTTNAIIATGDAAPDLTAICDPAACPACIFDASTMTVSVSFTGTHTWVSDLSFYLQAPNGAVISMIDGSCCPNSGDNFSNFTLTNGIGGSFSYSGAATPLSGSWNAFEGTAINWNALNGQDIYSSGWKVIVGDCVGGDVGNLDQAIPVSYTHLTLPTIYSV